MNNTVLFINQSASTSWQTTTNGTIDSISKSVTTVDGVSIIPPLNFIATTYSGAVDFNGTNNVGGSVSTNSSNKLPVPLVVNIVRAGNPSDLITSRPNGWWNRPSTAPPTIILVNNTQNTLNLTTASQVRLVPSGTFASNIFLRVGVGTYIVNDSDGGPPIYSFDSTLTGLQVVIISQNDDQYSTTVFPKASTPRTTWLQIVIGIFILLIIVWLVVWFLAASTLRKPDLVRLDPTIE